MLLLVWMWMKRHVEMGRMRLWGRVGLMLLIWIHSGCWGRYRRRHLLIPGGGWHAHMLGHVGRRIRRVHGSWPVQA